MLSFYQNPMIIFLSHVGTTCASQAWASSITSPISQQVCQPFCRVTHYGPSLNMTRTKVVTRSKFGRPSSLRFRELRHVMPQRQVGIIESHGRERARESPSVCEKELNCPLRRSMDFPSGPALPSGQLMYGAISGNREKGNGEPPHPSSSPCRQSGFLFYPRAVREPGVASNPAHPHSIKSNPVPLRLIRSANLISTLTIGSAARVLVATAPQGMVKHRRLQRCRCMRILRGDIGFLYLEDADYPRPRNAKIHNASSGFRGGKEGGSVVERTGSE